MNVPILLWNIANCIGRDICREKRCDREQRLLILFLLPVNMQRVGKTALVDGLFGGSTFVESWVGWEGTDGAFVIDLGKERDT